MVDSRVRWQTDIAVWPSTANKGKTIRFDVVQQGSIGPKGRSIHGTLRRADRYWGLYDTSQIIDSTESVFYTTEQLRQRDEYKRLEQVMACLCAMQEAGLKSVTSGAVTYELGKSYGIQSGPGKVGRIIASLGVKEKRTGTVRAWSLTSLPFSVQEVAS